jgi:hypothetical protein
MSARALWLVVLATSATAQRPCASSPSRAPTSFFLEVTRRDSAQVARLCLVSATPVGSYMATISFDSSHMRAIHASAPLGMQAINTTVPGMIRIAGASTSGFANGVLAVVSFAHPVKANEPMSLTVSEVSGTRGASLLQATRVTGWPPHARPPAAPVIDSVSPRSAVLEPDRVTDIAIYGRGFAPTGNAVVFGTAEVSGLASEADGTVLRFPAPFVRVLEGQLLIRVRHDGLLSNGVILGVRKNEP